MMAEVLPGMAGLPRDEQGPVFNEPWEAKAFAMVLRLHERGLFTWPEWAEALSQEISAAQAGGDADLGDTYYQHWLRALETLAARKGAALRGRARALPAGLGRGRRAHAAWSAGGIAAGVAGINSMSVRCRLSPLFAAVRTPERDPTR